MERIVGLILETVVAAVVVIFLIAYLTEGSINGGSGFWEGMGLALLGEV